MKKEKTRKIIVINGKNTREPNFMWNTITNTLNDYGGWISLIGLLFSIVLALITGNIRKNIKLILEHKEMNKQRSKIQSSLAKNIQSICQNIKEDKIFDISIIAELEEIIGILEQHKKIFPINIQIELLYVQHELRKKTVNIDQEQLCKKLSHIKGALKYESTYIG